MKKFKLVIIGALVIGIVFVLSNKNDKGQNAALSVIKDSIDKKKSVTRPKDKELEKSKVVLKENVPVSKEAPVVSEKEKINAYVEEVSQKLDACRAQIGEQVKEKDLQALESQIWDIVDNGKKLNPDKFKQIFSEIIDKINVISSFNWHMEELSKATNMVMDEKVALKEPQWVLKQGSKLRPCGIYLTHRLYGLLSEVSPMANELPREDKEFIEEKVLGYTKSMINYTLGAASVAMQVELLGALSSKRFFNDYLQDGLKDLERRLNEEMDIKFEGTDGDNQALVKSIINDFHETQQAKDELNELLKSFRGI